MGEDETRLGPVLRSNGSIFRPRSTKLKSHTIQVVGAAPVLDPQLIDR